MDMNNKLQENQEVNSFDNKITLLNGTTLICYLKAEQPGSIKEEDEKKNRMQDLKFFLDHAFDFFKNADRIFQDSRMFLAPVPCPTWGDFRTLGIILEWWINSGGKFTKDKEGNDALTYEFAGNPMTGTNSCRCVYPDGTDSPIYYNSFMYIWKSYRNISDRYKEAKQRFEAYSLQEVWEILSSTEQ